MGNTISSISQRITIQYIDTIKNILNHNNKKYPLLVDVDKISEFLCDKTEWSSSESIDISELYWEFMCWLKEKYKINNYNEEIFVSKLSKKRTIIDNKVCNIKMSNMFDSDFLRL